MGHNRQEQIEDLQEEIKKIKDDKNELLVKKEALKKTEWWYKTKRDEYEGWLRNIANALQKERRKKKIEELISYQKIVLIRKTIDEGKGLLGQTIGEGVEIELNNIEKRLQDAREKLKIIQSWPSDP